MKPYIGERAQQYEAKRASTDQWHKEHAFVAEHIGRPRRVLDCPVGTGRFLPIYQSIGAQVVGVDVSDDMLRLASEKGYGELRQGSVFELSERADVAVCVRLLNWLPMKQVRAALSRLAECAPRVIVSVRTRTVEPAKQSGTINHQHDEFMRALECAGLTVRYKAALNAKTYGTYWMMDLVVD